MTRADGENHIEMAIRFARCGEYVEAVKVLELSASESEEMSVSPLLYYYQAYYYKQMEESDKAGNLLKKASMISPKYCFPYRLETLPVLEWAISENRITSSEVMQYIIQEVWYFDSKLSSLQVRILGICPIRISFNNETNSLEKRRLFWIKYDPFRRAFANFEAFNRYNDAHRISYDDVLLQRRFDGFILAESNVYDNRMVNEYELGKNALLESERIKQVIFDFEQDLWEY